MVEEARPSLPASSTGASLDQELALRIGRALVVGLGLLAVLLLVFWTSILHVVPDYPAVVLALLITLVLPGYFLQRALLADTHPLAGVAAMPALGLGLIALPGFLALEAHVSIDEFALLYAAFAASVCAIATLFWPDRSGPATEGLLTIPNVAILAMLVVVAGGIVTTPFWAEDRLAGDFDDWTYMAYARDYMDADRMNENEPFFGTDDPPTPRMRDNVWVLTEALVAKSAGVPVSEVLLTYLPPLLATFAFLATLGLTWTLLSSMTVALLAVAFQAGYALLDLSPHEGMGRNLLMRISEDKMVGAFILFPIALVFVARFADKRSFASVAGFSTVVLGISFVHPVPLVFLAITIGTLALIRFAQDRDIRANATLLGLLIPVALGAIWPFVQSQLLRNSAPELFGIEESAITYRDAFRVLELGGGFLIGNYHMIIHPLVLLAIVLAPLAWWIGRRNVGSQMLLAMTGGALLAFFVPFLATPLSDVMTPQTLWKVPWMIPVGPVLGYLTYEGARWLGASTGGRSSRVALAAVPAVAVVLVLSAALLVQEQYVRADGGAFYDWRRNGSFLPGPDESIFLGGVDRSFSGSWRLAGYEKALVAHMEEEIPHGSVVLAEPQQLNHMLPGVLPDVYPVDFGGAAGEGQRRQDVQLFIGGGLDGNVLDAVLERWGVDYIVVRETQPGNQPLTDHPALTRKASVAPYLIYRVDRSRL